MRSCPSDAELLSLALIPEGPAPSSDPVAGHVAQCVRCQREVAELREAAAGVREVDAPRPDGGQACLDDDAVATLAEGFEDQRVPHHYLVHLAECGDCRERVAAVSRILRHEDVAAEVHHLDASSERPGRQRRWLRLGSGLAAAAVVVLALYGVYRSPPIERRLREEPVTFTSAPVPLQPAGTVARVDSLSWHVVPRATQYRVTLFSQEGSTVWESGTSDTVALLPRGIGLVPGAVYYWKVEARTDWNRWTASEMVEIRIGGDR